jgi:hypothetical protein
MSPPEPQKKSRKRRKSGPSPERVKIKGDWETAVGKALKKERPKEGWPGAPGKDGKSKGA